MRAVAQTPKSNDGEMTGALLPCDAAPRDMSRFEPMHDNVANPITQGVEGMIKTGSGLHRPLLQRLTTNDLALAVAAVVQSSNRIRQ